MAMEAQDMTVVVVLVCSFKKRQTTREIETTKNLFFSEKFTKKIVEETAAFCFGSFLSVHTCDGCVIVARKNVPRCKRVTRWDFERYGAKIAMRHPIVSRYSARRRTLAISSQTVIAPSQSH